jgi:hypothetical protein
MDKEAMKMKKRNIQKLFITCRKHIAMHPEMESSARVALADAIYLYDTSDIRSKNYDLSYQRALDSLRYSVGVFHKDYIKFNIPK